MGCKYISNTIPIKEGNEKQIMGIFSNIQEFPENLLASLE